MHNNWATQFKILSLHHVNKPRVKQCTHRCQWVIINDVDIAVDTQSYLHRGRTARHKAGSDKPNGHKTITVSLLAPPKQTNGKISGNIYSIWKCPGNHTGVFCFFGEAKQRGLNRGDKSSPSGEGTHRSSAALEDGFSQRFHGQRLGGRKDIKAFFPELTEEYREVGWSSGFWPKAEQEVRECHASTQSCAVVAADLLAKHKALSSRPWLLKVDVDLCHCATVIFCKHCNAETIEFEP